MSLSPLYKVAHRLGIVSIHNSSLKKIIKELQIIDEMIPQDTEPLIYVDLGGRIVVNYQRLETPEEYQLRIDKEIEKTQSKRAEKVILYLQLQKELGLAPDNSEAHLHSETSDV